MEQLVEKRWNVSVTGPPPVYPPVPPSAQCGNEGKNARQGRGGGGCEGEEEEALAKEELRRFYAPHNQRLAALLRRDLWGSKEA